MIDGDFVGNNDANNPHTTHFNFYHAQINMWGLKPDVSTGEKEK